MLALYVVIVVVVAAARVLYSSCALPCLRCRIILWLLPVTKLEDYPPGPARQGRGGAVRGIPQERKLWEGPGSCSGPDGWGERNQETHLSPVNGEVSWLDNKFAFGLI